MYVRLKVWFAVPMSWLAFLFVVSVCCFFGVEKVVAQEPDEWFQLQGEYSGEIKQDGESQKVAVQVIAVGDDKFEATFLFGGLPGDGWDPEMGIDAGNPMILEDGTIVAAGNDGEKLTIVDNVLKYYEDDKLIGELKRVVRESETLGMKPPEGATVLFDGSSDEETGEHFEAQDGNSPVIEGLLRQGVISKQKFGGDFTVHIEFRLPFEPTKTGQARGNSGLYLQGRYEVQMLDSFGLSGEHNECGGIYSVKKPDLNMCYPPELWQTYDIEFTSAKWDGDAKTANARMTVKHNGVLIHDDVEVPKTTTAAPLKESAEPGYLYLQNHGSPVRYRNIWVVEK